MAKGSNPRRQGEKNDIIFRRLRRPRLFRRPAVWLIGIYIFLPKGDVMSAFLHQLLALLSQLPLRRLSSLLKDIAFFIGRGELPVQTRQFNDQTQSQQEQDRGGDSTPRSEAQLRRHPEPQA